MGIIFVYFVNQYCLQYGPFILLGLILLVIFTDAFSPLGAILSLAGPLLEFLGVPSLLG